MDFGGWNITNGRRQEQDDGNLLFRSPKQVPIKFQKLIPSTPSPSPHSGLLIIF